MFYKFLLRVSYYDSQRIAPCYRLTSISGVPSLFNFATYPSPKLAIPWIYPRRSYDVPTTFGQFLAKLSVTNPKLST